MWQQIVFERIKRLLTDNPSVCEVVPLGSLSSHESDQWSDLDVGIVVREESLGQFYPAIDWIKPFGDTYAHNQSTDGHKATTRVVFADATRVDFSITTNKKFLNTGTPVFKDEVQSRALKSLTNDFKFDAFLAASKIARDDLLIGLHLVLELERKCLVLGMMLRDRQVGVTHHRFGGPFNEVIQGIEPFGPSKTQLLERMLSVMRLFDQLARQLEPTERRDWGPLDDYIKKVQTRTEKYH
jgi:hypothetical protein